jgi:hypothetical protein
LTPFFYTTFNQSIQSWSKLLQLETQRENVMTQLLVHHKVQDYAAWRPVFDEMGAVRAQNGSTGAQVFRNAADSNEIVIIADLDNARQYAQSPELREAMQRAGVVSQPEVLFLEEA